MPERAGRLEAAEAAADDDDTGFDLIRGGHGRLCERGTMNVVNGKREPMFDTAIAGSLPKPAWLAETHKLWPQWKATGDELRQAKADATLLWIKAQEDAGLDIVSDGEQSRQHFVH